MKADKILKLSLGALFTIPVSVFFGGEILANHLYDSVQYEMHNETHLLACGGGGGNKPGALKTKKLN